MAWQADGELGERAGFALNRDRAAMLLGDNVVADRQTEPGAFAGRLGGEEGLKELVLDLRRDAGTVVANPHLCGLAQIARPYGQHRAKPVRGLAGALRCSVKAVPEQVQKRSGDLLWCQRNRCKMWVAVALHCDV